MKLFSHGENSDLREHLAEVMTAAETPEERIICACHDLGKATKAWQTYITGKLPESPHHHAAAGGVFAALLLLERGGDEPAYWALVALHAGAAHHTMLQQLGTMQLNDLPAVAGDAQAKAFALDRESGIASLLPELPASVLEAAWRRLEGIAPAGAGEARGELNRACRTLSPERRLRAYLHSRSLLGRLCLQDHRSAARQSGKAVEVSSWRNAFPDREFRPRPQREFSGHSRIAELRTRLRNSFLEAVEEDGVFYFIDAPTGLGKTEAMLRGAEKLLARGKFRRIVFAVPQVSVADQVFEDYFSMCDAQIWNYRRRESHTASGEAAETRRGNGADAEALEIEEHPFSSSYNVTTFNQVLLAMCHPARNRCIRGLGLHDAVVILDEFHKLPQVILPFFFRIAREYAAANHCRFILGSATPLEPFPFWDLQDSRRIDAAVTGPIYTAQEINNRRLYRSLGPLTVTELGERIEAFQATSDRNLLVVVNLVGRGSWPLRRFFDREFQPWRQLEELRAPGRERIIVWLDGLVPPGLRRELVLACREAMKQRPVTLISTQMVEVGVDLDFDAALIDYQGIAATIQRGGRVGRNGRSEPCEVHVFTLIDDTGKSSRERLLDVQAKYDSRLKVSPFDQIYSRETHFLSLEEKFFRNWNAETTLRDSDLTTQLSDIQNKIFSRLSVTGLLEKWMFLSEFQPQTLGCTFEKAQWVAELFDSESGSELILVESQEILDRLSLLNRRIQSNESSPEERREFLALQSDRKIAPSSAILPELGLGEPVGLVSYPDELPVYLLKAMIL